MRVSAVLLGSILLSPIPAAAQMDPGAVAAGEAVRHDNERHARRVRGLPAQAPQSAYERWRNRPGKRDCGAYNWKCPARPRDATTAERPARKPQ
jgi:hypothetical protein